MGFAEKTVVNYTLYKMNMNISLPKAIDPLCLYAGVPTHLRNKTPKKVFYVNIKRK